MNPIDELFNTLTAREQSKQRPPLHLWQPENTGTIDIRIDGEGRWYHEGTLIERQPLVDLFATILRREGDVYYLVTPAEKLRIEVADAPFLAVDMDVRGTGVDAQLLFTTNVGDFVIADAEHALTMRGQAPYLRVRDELDARLTRSVYYRLVDYAAEEQGAAYVYSNGARFCLGSLH